MSPAWAQTTRRINRCRTNEITIATLQKYGVDLRRSAAKRQTGRGYPRGTIGTSLMPLSPLRGKTIRVCHILMNFPLDADRLPVHTAAFFDDILFNESNPESMASFYKEVSYGQIRITGKTFGWFNFGATANNPLGLPRAAVAVDITTGGVAQFIPQVIRQTDPFIDFSQFDGDGDGRVDVLIVTFPNPTGYYDLVFGRATGTPVDPAVADPLLNNTAYNMSLARIRALSGANIPPIPTNDAVVVDSWDILSEDNAGLTTGFNNGVSSYAHEVGHSLGLPDLTDETNALFPRISVGLGWWDGMALGNRNDPAGFNLALRPQLQGGIVHFSAWCKFALGWLTPIPVTTQLNQVTIPAVETNPIVYRMNVNGDPLSPEYFLIENRQNIGRFDSLLRGTTLAAPPPGPAPGTGPSQRLAHGLLVWHIDETVIENSAAGTFIVTDINHPGLKLMQADGRNDMDQVTITSIAFVPWNLTNFGFAGMFNGNFGDDSDPFPGTLRVTEFSFTTNPSSQSYTGFDSGVRISNITEQRSNIIADLNVTPVFNPTITLIQPTEGQRTANATPTIHAVYSNGSALGNDRDPLLISSIDILLDNQEIVTDGQPNDPQAGTFSFDGTNIIFRPIRPLTSGRHTVLIRGNDQVHAGASPPFVSSALVNFTVQPIILTQAAGTSQMISFPFYLTTTPGLLPNNAAQLVKVEDLTKAGPQFVLQSPTPRIARFDLSRNGYHFFSPVPPPGARPTDPFVDLLFPGCAYWVAVPSEGVPLRIEGNAVPGNATFQIIHEDSALDGTLPPGFRMIGNPFDFTVDWASVQVEYQGVRMSLQQAINNTPPLISPVIYTFTPQGYKFATAPEGQLIPFEGHWIKLLQPVKLFIPPARSALRSPAKSEPRASASDTEVHWRLQLSASVGGSSDTYNYIGAATNAEDDEDRYDVPKAPPAPGSRVVLNVLSGSGKLAQDLRKGPLSGRQVYNLEVITSEPNTDVRLTWSNLNDVPKGYAVYLRDAETQKQVYLRTTSGYTFNTGANTVRHLQIIVDPNGSRPLNVLVRTAKAQAGVGAVFTYTLTQDADVQATILSPTGQVVRRFNIKSALAGVHTLNWDSKDSRGRALGRGVYLLRLQAQTADHQISQGVTTFTLR